MKPAALVFDAYGTLFDVHSVAQRCESFWPGAGTKVSQLWRSKQLEWTWQRSLMRRYVPFSQVTRDALAYACAALDLAVDEEKIATLMREYVRLALYPDVSDALAVLRTAGYRLAVLTNGSPDMIGPLVERSGLAFDAVLSVDEQKIFKPAPEVYGLAAKRLDLSPPEIGFVSSNGWDALGAKSFGFRVWWINRAGAPLDRLDFQPDGMVSGLGELPAALAR
ncbi:MAG TPA: haloacid dehalogenase type II [Burkholderiales bacterium]|jgi:2-haloacid dehalogenase|nr:haloacid dehalogenase type II [Burkholderiales bacterium]